MLKTLTAGALATGTAVSRPRPACRRRPSPAPPAAASPPTRRLPPIAPFRPGARLRQRQHDLGIECRRHRRHLRHLHQRHDWTASAGVGGGSGASFATRKMTSGANLLNYNLYTTSGSHQVWGDGTGSTATLGGTGTGSAQAVTVYGRVASRPDHGPGRRLCRHRGRHRHLLNSSGGPKHAADVPPRRLRGR